MKKITAILLVFSAFVWGVFLGGEVFKLRSKNVSVVKNTHKPPLSTSTLQYLNQVLPTSTMAALAQNNQPFGGMDLRNLLIMNQLFNNGKKFPLGDKKEMNFSDFVLLNELFEGQMDDLLAGDASAGSSDAKVDLGDLILINQIFNNGKALPTNNAELGNLVLLYLLFK